MTSAPQAALCAAAARLYQRNLLAAGDGNLSLRLEDGTLAMTPSGVCKADLHPDQLALVHADGSVRSGQPSSERALHLQVYRCCPEARAVVHAHPPTAIAWSLAHPDASAFPVDAMPEVILAAGSIPIAPYARPGTEALAASILPFLPHHRLMILARHGGLAWGETLEEAVAGMERLEHVAQILVTALRLGGWTPLPPGELAALQTLRAELGPRLR